MHFMKVLLFCFATFQLYDAQMEPIIKSVIEQQMAAKNVKEGMRIPDKNVDGIALSQLKLYGVTKWSICPNGVNMKYETSELSVCLRFQNLDIKFHGYKKITFFKVHFDGNVLFPHTEITATVSMMTMKVSSVDVSRFDAPRGDLHKVSPKGPFSIVKKKAKKMFKKMLAKSRTIQNFRNVLRQQLQKELGA